MPGGLPGVNWDAMLASLENSEREKMMEQICEMEEQQQQWAEMDLELRWQAENLYKLCSPILSDEDKNWLSYFLGVEK
jgi:hypothetical protein